MAWWCRGKRLSRLLLLFLAAYVLGILYVLVVPIASSRGSLWMGQHRNIDIVIKGQWDPGPHPQHYLPKSCRAQKDLVFIKSMKCATETLGTVFRRYGYLHNLSMVLPVEKRIYLGWPFPITAHDYRPSSRGYNMLMEHSVYNASFLRKLMNPGTVYLTIIREPLDMFVSSLNYFNVFELANVPIKQGMEAVQLYLRNMDHYEAVYKSSAAAPKRYCIPDGFSITKNLMSHCLGMPLGFPAGSENIGDKLGAVASYIRQLDSEFLLVMIKEYFEESLVLLKRLLCWDTKDLLYHSSNMGSYRSNINWRVLTQQDRLLHKHWSSADYMLYDHFNKTFWRKVHAQGPDFHHEVAFFRSVQQQVTSFCRNVTPYGESYIRFPESPWSPAFSVSAADCRLMAAPLLLMLKERYQQLEPTFANFSSDSLPRQFQPLC